MQSADAKEGPSSLRDVIVTLPTPTFVALAVATAATLIGAALAAVLAPAQEIRGAAAGAVVVMLPMVIALIGAGGVRRTSTRQIDRLVDGFLCKTVLERLQLWCESDAQAGGAYPFRAVQLLTPTGGRSYAHYRFAWRDPGLRLPPGRVAVKMNVFNFEVVMTLDLQVPPGRLAGVDLGNEVYDRANLHEAARHPLVSRFFGTVQGSIEEGYAVRASFSEPQHGPDGTRITLLLSLRQKLATTFLTSPFLKRYFAEDAAIVIGVTHHELLASGMAAPADADRVSAAPQAASAAAAARTPAPAQGAPHG